jgi:hypothetical protein
MHAVMHTLRTVATFGLLPVPPLSAATSGSVRARQASAQVGTQAGTGHDEARMLPGGTAGGVRGSDRGIGRAKSALQPGTAHDAATTLAVL